jgi:hypothetical protein
MLDTACGNLEGVLSPLLATEAGLQSDLVKASDGASKLNALTEENFTGFSLATLSTLAFNLCTCDFSTSICLRICSLMLSLD